MCVCMRESHKDMTYLCIFLAYFCYVIFGCGLQDCKKTLHCVTGEDSWSYTVSMLIVRNSMTSQQQEQCLKTAWKITCLHSLRHSTDMASSQQPRPTHPSDLLDTPGSKQTRHQSPSEVRAHRCVLGMCRTLACWPIKKLTISDHIYHPSFVPTDKKISCVLEAIILLFQRKKVCVMNYEYEY